MLPWWGWVLFWVVLLAASAGFLGWRAWLVWGKTRVLGREVQRASELVAALESRADELREVDPDLIAAIHLAHRMRAQYRKQRAFAKAARHVRRADRLPPWARVH